MRKYMTAAALEPTDTGSLQVNVVSAENNFPIRDAEVSIAYKGDPESTVESTNTNSSGQTGEIRLAAPPLEYSLSPGLIQPYSEYTITIRARGFAEVAISGTEILPDALAIQPVRMTPLADEVSPDTCRLWDKETHEKLDKDRFRRDMGNVEDAYNEVFRRLGIADRK